MNGDFRPLTPEERTELDNFTMKELEGNNGWRPIEEAPKDGTPVILWRGGENINRATIGWYDPDTRMWSDGTDEPAYPSMWMPLANPPKK